MNMEQVIFKFDLSVVLRRWQGSIFPLHFSIHTNLVTFENKGHHIVLNGINCVLLFISHELPWFKVVCYCD